MSGPGPSVAATLQFEDKFGYWPRGLEHLPPIDPSPTVINWIKSRNIAWARARAS
jgi:DNA repair protein RadD